MGYNVCLQNGVNFCLSQVFFQYGGRKWNFGRKRWENRISAGNWQPETDRNFNI